MNGVNFREVVFLVVPAIIAIVLVATICANFLLNGNEQPTPDHMVQGLNVILGYYFGVAVREAAA